MPTISGSIPVSLAFALSGTVAVDNPVVVSGLVEALLSVTVSGSVTSTAKNFIALANAAVASGTFMLWHTSGLSVSGGILLTAYGVHGDWTLSYFSGSVPANLVLSGAKIFDVRILSGVLSAGAIADYFNDIKNNSGNKYLPAW